MGGENVVIIPKGLRRIAQGCRAATPLGGRASRRIYPKGVAYRGATLRNPFRVDWVVAAITALRGNPGLSYAALRAIFTHRNIFRPATRKADSFVRRTKRRPPRAGDCSLALPEYAEGAIAWNPIQWTPRTAATSARVQARWYQYSLRSLMIFVLVCGVLLGWAGSFFKRLHEQRQAVTRIEGLGGTVNYDYRYHDGQWDSIHRPGQNCSHGAR